MRSFPKCGRRGLSSLSLTKTACMAPVLLHRSRPNPNMIWNGLGNYRFLWMAERHGLSATIFIRSRQADSLPFPEKSLAYLQKNSVRYFRKSKNGCHETLDKYDNLSHICFIHGSGFARMSASRRKAGVSRQGEPQGSPLVFLAFRIAQSNNGIDPSFSAESVQEVLKRTNVTYTATVYTLLGGGSSRAIISGIFLVDEKLLLGCNSLILFVRRRMEPRATF